MNDYDRLHFNRTLQTDHLYLPGGRGHSEPNGWRRAVEVGGICSRAPGEVGAPKVGAVIFGNTKYTKIL